MSKIHKPWVSHEELDAFLGGGVLDVLDHAASHEVGGGDLLAFADIPDFGDWLDQAVREADSPLFANLNLGATPLIRQSAGALTFQTDEGVNTLTSVIIRGKGTGIGDLKLYDDDDNEYLRFYSAAGVGYIRVMGVAPAGLTFQDNNAQPIKCFPSLAAGNPYFYVYGWHATDTDWMRMRVEADGDALIEAENDLNLRAGGGEINLGDENLTTTGIITGDSLVGDLHWDNITNEPLFYPPEFHYHVGRDIISLHLVDLDDVEADDIFDILPTAAIHGEGNYDWWGTWDTTAAANTSAEIVVLAGDDKMLQLVDNNAADFVKTELSTDAGHPIVTGVVQFQMRVTVANNHAYFELDKDAVSNMYIYFGTAPQTIRFHGGVAEENCGAWVANTWYTIRIHFDCVARAAVIFLGNVFIARIALSAAAAGDYVSILRVRTKTGFSGYNVEVNNLKVFNLTI